MQPLRSAQIRYLAIICSSWLAIFTVTRSVLLFRHWQEADAGPGGLLRIYGAGLVYDLAFLLYALLPLAAALLLVPSRWWRRAWFPALLKGLAGASVFIMLFVAAAEGLFWDEFGVRFNFIAVDYLVYSKEVVNNITESYPIYPLLGGLALVSVAAATGLSRPIRKICAAPLLAWRRSVSTLALAGLLAGGCVLVVSQDFPNPPGGNVYQHELAANGPYQFFAAFRNNELDYSQFYASLPADLVGSQLRAELAEPNATFIGSDPLDIRRRIDNPGSPRRLNVILVTVESLSARYLGRFGNRGGLTPNLDRLAAQSLTFSRFYATGTRTDRGLEAITLSVPPTPGRSIVKRIGRESGYASLGQQLAAQGYDSVFIYGGRGYFDNMNAFFGGNGYRIVDQSSVPEPEIHFKNAWGMADEDLYAQAIKVADAGHAAGRPFFLQLMTTSNHRPYTYPDNRIDIPSGKGRDGAVKYTDYAIGKFLADARRQPWFASTIFVFVADHTAGSAGHEDLPVANYHIPLIIHAPGLIEPGEFGGIASQIDLAPTLLGLLNLDYTSTFFGRNVLLDSDRPGRAPVGNYQHLGFFDGHDLAILSPRRQIRRHDNALETSREIKASTGDSLVQRGIAYYQGASAVFRQGGLAWRGILMPE